MSIQLLLDSAIMSEVEQAAAWGWVRSATTNPTLLAQSDLAPAETLRQMGALLPGQIFYQLTGSDLESMQKEAAMAAQILGKQLVLKIAATPLGMQATARLSEEYTCAVTSIFSAAQALTAHSAGARYALYYHNRAKRLLENGERLAAELVSVLEGSGSEVVAASLKSPGELVEARLAGVRILSAPFTLLAQLPQHEFSDQALAEFNAKGSGLLA